MLCLDEVAERAGLCQSYLYAMIARGEFPALVALGARARGLPDDELDQWLASCLALRAGMKSLLDPVVLPSWPVAPVPIPCSGIRFLRKRDVLERLNCSTNHLYRLIRHSGFPRPAPVGVKARRWAEHEVEAWLNDARAHRARRLKLVNPWVCSPPGSAL